MSAKLFPKTVGLKQAYKVLDTSVIIDGRVADVCETGFLEGTLVVPQFVLRELQQIADSSDALKRNRGKRGFDVLQRLQRMSKITVRIHDQDFPQIREVDRKLIELAKTLGGKVVTNDYNLNKIAELSGVPVLNINELANALKPVVLPGELMHLHVVKEGKEAGQGVAYLDDGTMVVVDHGRKLHRPDGGRHGDERAPDHGGPHDLRPPRAGGVAAVTDCPSTARRHVSAGAVQAVAMVPAGGIGPADERPAAEAVPRASAGRRCSSARCARWPGAAAVSGSSSRCRASASRRRAGSSARPGCRRCSRWSRAGRERQESVWLGLQAAGQTPSGCWCTTRCGRSSAPALVARVLAAAGATGAATCGLPVRETVKRVREDGAWSPPWTATGLWLIQTPQAFRRDAPLGGARQGAPRRLSPAPTTPCSWSGWAAGWRSCLGSPRT